MDLVSRAKNIIVAPKTEWEAIAADTTPNGQLVVGYVLPLAAIAAIAGFIGMSLVGMSMPMMGTVRVGIVWGLVSAVYHLVMAVVIVYVVAFVIDALAPTFGAQKGFAQALKVAAYSYTPVWIASIVMVIPLLGIIVLIAAIYAIYLLYLGLPRVMHGPQEKAAGYTVVVVIVAIVIGVIVSWIATAIMGYGMPHRGFGMGAALPRGEVTFDKNSAMGKLDDFSKKMEEANKRMEAAQKSGDPAKQAEAAMAALGTAMSGGKGVDPVQLDQLKPFVPEKLAGLPRTDMTSDRSGVKGFMAAKVQATYSDGGGRKIDLEVTDTGGAAGLVGLASWMGVQGEHEDSRRREVTRKDGTRLVHEVVDKQSPNSKYSVLLAERYVVSAEGHGVDLAALKSAVDSVDLAKLESLK